MDELAQFRQTFFTECEELLGDLEGHLMNLQSGEGDKDTLNAVFRAIHSVKGGAGAFGFDRLVAFAHIFETVLDLMRDGRLEPTPDSVLLVLRCADILSDLVRAAQSGTDLPADHEGEGRKALIDLAASIGVNADPHAADDELAALDAQLAAGGPDAVIAAEAAPAEPEPGPAATAEAPAKAPLLKYLVKFTPRDALYQRANEPLILIRELRDLGGFLARADTSAIPAFDQMQAEGAYIKWEFEIETDKGEQAIRDVFEFVLDDCDLDVVCLNPPGAAAEPAPAASVKPAPAAKTETPAPAPAAPKADSAPPRTEPAAKAEPGPARPAAGGKAEGGGDGKAVRSIRVDLDRVDKLVNMVGELVITHAMIAQQTEHLHADQHPELANGLAELSHHIRDLQESVMAMRAQPVKSVFARLPRLVRELAQMTNKKIRLDMSGENTEIDKTVIEQLGDPLTHMIRNSCDHGIESPEDRAAAGKPQEGVIHVSADQRGGRIVIEITDDGRGINRINLGGEAVFAAEEFDVDEVRGEGGGGRSVCAVLVDQVRDGRAKTVNVGVEILPRHIVGAFVEQIVGHEVLHRIEQRGEPVLEEAIVSVRHQEIADAVDALLSELGALEGKIAHIVWRQAFDDILLDAAGGRDVDGDLVRRVVLVERPVALARRLGGEHVRRRPRSPPSSK